jgi:hypothetical protein
MNDIDSVRTSTTQPERNSANYLEDVTPGVDVRIDALKASLVNGPLRSREILRFMRWVAAEFSFSVMRRLASRPGPVVATDAIRDAFRTAALQPEVAPPTFELSC